MESTPEERSLWSAKVCDTLLGNIRVIQSNIILAFHPLKDEVNILPLLKCLFEEGKTILIPEVISDTEMQLRIYNPEDKMQEGVLGTQVPQGHIYTDYQDIDLIIVPGVAFDRQGHRLGRGKGYYDRFLKSVPQAFTIGICFPYQLLEKVPHESHDAIMNEIIIR